MVNLYCVWWVFLHHHHVLSTKSEPPTCCLWRSDPNSNSPPLPTSSRSQNLSPSPLHHVCHSSFTDLALFWDKNEHCCALEIQGSKVDDSGPLVDPFAQASSTRQASNNEDVRGWADKLYEHQPLPGKHLPAQRIPCPAAAAGTSDAAVATTPGWAEHAAGGTARKKGGANTRPTAALAAIACQKKGGKPPTDILPAVAVKPITKQPSLRVVSRSRRRPTVKSCWYKPAIAEKRSPRKKRYGAPVAATPAPAPSPAVAAAPSPSPAPAPAPAPSTIDATVVIPMVVATTKSMDAEGSATTAVAAPTEKARRRPSKTSQPTGSKIEGGTICRVQREVRGNRGSATDNIPAGNRVSASTNILANIPETYGIDSSNRTQASFQKECKRTALLDLARADMDRVNLEREFLNKNARFDQSKSTHIYVRERWLKATMMLDATSNAANVYFVAEERAGQKHAAACRDRRVSQGGLDGAVNRSVLAHAAVRKATEVFRAAGKQVKALLQESNDRIDNNSSRRRAVTVSMATPRTSKMASYGGDDANNSSSDQGCPAKKRKRSHSESNRNAADEVLTGSEDMVTTTNVRRSQDSAAEARDVGDAGCKGGEGAYREGCRPSKSRSATGINGLSSEEERQSHARGLEAQRQIRTRIASQGNDAAAAKEWPHVTAAPTVAVAASTPTAQTTTVGAVDLELALEAAKFELATADRSVQDGAVSARLAVAEVSRAALKLAGAVREETEAAAAHWAAADRARPYVSWVNNEVTTQRSLHAWSSELMGTTSLAWEAREKARRELKKARERVSKAVRVLKSVSPGEQVDISRHALFTAVVADRNRQR